jgi:type VI secretion system Hcp family effector
MRFARSTPVCKFTRARRALTAACIEAIEPRLLLSASLSYQAQKPDGTLDTPVTFQTKTPPKDFSPAQASLLKKGFTAPAYDLFLNLTNIPGGSTDTGHPNEIDIQSFSWAADSSFTTSGGGGGGVGKSTLQELHLTSRVSKASPLLLSRLASGQHIQNAELTVRKPGAQPFEFLKIKLTDVVISSYQLTTATDGTPLEEFSLNFDRSRVDYTPQKSDGSADTPIVVEEAGLDVQDFSPTESSLLQSGFTQSNSQNFFLSLDNIPGQSTQHGHENEIDVLAFSLGGDGTAASLGGGGGSGKTTFQELHFVSRVSKASPKLLAAMTSGERISMGELTASTSGANPFEYLDINLDDVVVSSYQLASQPDGAVVEEVTLNFGDFGVDYIPQKADGSADSPVQFQTHLASVNDYSPTQRSLLDAANTSGLANASLQLPGIPSDAGDIAVRSFSWGGDATVPLLGGGGGVGKSTLQELHIVSRLSKASPLLLAYANSGEHLTQADLFLRQSGGVNPVYLQIELNNVLVSSYRVTTAIDGSFLEEYTLNFADSKLDYNTLKSDGSVDAVTSFEERGLDVQDFTPVQSALLDTPLVPPANLDLFLNLDNIPGESTDAHHAGQIDINSFSWGANTTPTVLGGGGGAGKSTLHEIHVVAPLSKASPKILAEVASGQHIASAHFAATRAGNSAEEFLSLDLDDLTISSYQLIVAGNGKVMEEFTLSYDGATLKYFPQKTDGSLDTPTQVSINHASVEDFTPPQRILLDTGLTGPIADHAFLDISSVPGESTDSNHPNQIDVLSYSFGANSTRTTFGGGGGVGKSTLQELHIVSHVSKASPLLLARMSSGQHLQHATLSLAHPGNKPDFYTLDLSDAVITSYNVTTASDGSLLEEYTLNFSTATESYKPANSDGSLGSAVSFSEHSLEVEHVAPPEHALLQAPLATPKNLDLSLNISGIPGESASDTHPGEIDLLAFAWGGDSPAVFSSGGGGGSSKATFHELHFVSHVSKASPSLLSRVLSGHHLPDATLSVSRKSDHQDFLKLRLHDVIVTSYQITTAPDGSLTEEFTLSYGPGAASGPIADAGGPYSVNDNSSVTLDASGSSDPNPDSLSYAWDLDGDGIFGEAGTSAARGDEVGVNPTFSATGLFGPAIYTISLRVTDGSGLTDTATTSVRIIDVTPPETIILTGPSSLTNQTSATFTFTGTDQGTAAADLAFTWQLDGGVIHDATSPLTLTGLADGLHTILITATDQAGNTDPTPASFTWKIDTLGPTIINPLAFPDPAPTGVPIFLSATASDTATGNSAITSAQYSLDGQTWRPLYPADFAFNSPSERLISLLPPLPPGVYTISLRATDTAGNTGPTSTLTLPVFSRKGKIQGNGSFISPAGADPNNPTATGAAKFDFDAQYKGHSNTPSGDVSFQFGNINFQSTSLDWLVITDDSAHLAGSGKINGQGNYAFELFVVDSGNNRHDPADLFRIRITDKSTGQVIYDNGVATPVPPLTPIKSGRIKVLD